jgi:arabinofuranosyltransferase
VASDDRAPAAAAPSGFLPRPERTVLVGVLFVEAVWCAVFIARTVVRAAGTHYFVLFDDALISFAYARRLAEGHGLNWALHGAPVEGFTHPLWVALMVPINLLGLPLRLRGLPVQALSAALLVSNTLLIARCARRHFSIGGTLDWLPATLATALTVPLNYWALAGMESALQALLTTLAVTLALDITERRENRELALWLVLALAYLLRMDMTVLAVAVWGFVLWRAGRPLLRRSPFWRGAGVFVLVVAGYELFRWQYFGDLLPNTYYLKLTGVPLAVRLLRGLVTLVDFGSDNWLLLCCAIAGSLAGWRLFRQAIVLPAAVVVAYALYNVWVGGDAYERITTANRFLCFVLPLVYLLIGAGAVAVRQALGLRRDRAAFACGAAAALLALGNGLFAADAETPWRQLLVLDRPDFALDSQILLPRLQRLERQLLPGGRVATGMAGIPAFFSDYQLIDILGYSDREVARRQATLTLSAANFRSFRPGHVKWDYAAVFRQQPDAFFTTYGIDDHEADFMARHGYFEDEGSWLRTGSPWIRAGAATVLRK